VAGLVSGEVCGVFDRFQHVTDAAYEIHRCPVFKGFVICVSGMASEERNSVRSIVEQNGETLSDI